MLLVGTSHGLRDLESGEKFVDGMAVTALAPGGTEGWYALLDCRSVVRLDRDMAGTVPAGELPEPDGQSLVVLPDGTVVVGRTGARLSIVGPHGEVRDIPAFQAVPGRDGWENPAGHAGHADDGRRHEAVVGQRACRRSVVVRGCRRDVARGDRARG